MFKGRAIGPPLQQNRNLVIIGAIVLDMGHSDAIFSSVIIAMIRKKN
jgi:hypothetical protein